MLLLGFHTANTRIDSNSSGETDWKRKGNDSQSSEYAAEKAKPATLGGVIESLRQCISSAI
jgi:hypothetical protein